MNTTSTPSNSAEHRLLAISPLDGRYASHCSDLSAYFSEFALIRYRLMVEVHWFIGLAQCPQISEVASLTEDEQHYLLQLIEQFSLADAAAIKAIERRTNHDVKALEYWLKEQMVAQASLAARAEFVHFACTSEDINNVAYTLMVKHARDQVIVPFIEQVLQQLAGLAEAYAEQAMMARTHGQPATPTTLGKEFANVHQRLHRACARLRQVALPAKLNGAVGNYNAHLVAYPEINWPDLSRQILHTLALEQNAYTTQIEPHDGLAELFDAVAAANTICLDLVRDLWQYIAIGYFKQKLVANEVGSSTMPHKINPIDFENAEGNLGLANALLRHLADKLPVSRWQRDLSDSTVLRNIGVALSHSLIAYRACLRGLGRIAVDEQRLHEDLQQNWALLAEPIQTVMRRFALPEPYEQLKALTRGQHIDQAQIAAFVDQLALPEHAKRSLLALSPNNYLGYAVTLTQAVVKQAK